MSIFNLQFAIYFKPSCFDFTNLIFYTPRTHHKLSQQLSETLWSDKRQSLIKTNLGLIKRCLVIVEIVIRLTCIINLLFDLCLKGLNAKESFDVIFGLASNGFVVATWEFLSSILHASLWNRFKVFFISRKKK